ncbi:hypothetical protein BH11MYX2_BH11MYX2_08250 [soil metagenome]
MPGTTRACNGVEVRGDLHAEPAVSWTPEQLAAIPRWDRENTLALHGRARGDLLGAWGNNLVARFGTDALARVRRRVGPPHDSLAPLLTDHEWAPVHAQLLITEAITDELFGGDLCALYPALLEDTRKGLGRFKLAALRALGVGRAFKIVPKIFNKVHDKGSVALETSEPSTGWTGVRLRFTGAPLFTNPTWRVLQLFATKVVLDLGEVQGQVVGHDNGQYGFLCDAGWKSR